jgi:hypothetical protein
MVQMLKELIEKLKRKKHQIQSYKSDNDDINTGIKVQEEKEVEIIVSSQNNITKIEIPDYVCIGDFVDKKNYGEQYKILDLLCNCVLWNSDKPYNTWKTGKIVTQVHYLEPIYYEEYKDLKTNEIAELVKNKISKKLQELTEIN